MVKVKQISVITTKVNYFKDYCFSLGIKDFDAIQRSQATSYINYRNTTSLTPSTLNKEIGFLNAFSTTEFLLVHTASQMPYVRISIPEFDILTDNFIIIVIIYHGIIVVCRGLFS